MFSPMWPRPWPYRQTARSSLPATQTIGQASFRDFAVARYTPDGRLDTTFDVDGKVTTNFGESEANARSVVVQPDGKLVVGGYGLGDGFIYDFLLARYNTDGTLDTTFSGDGKLSTDFSSPFDEGQSVTLQPDGKILVAGSTSLIPADGVSPSRKLFALARYNADGSADTTFGVDGKVTTPIGPTSTGRAVALQPDGKIVVAGNTTLTDNAEFTLVRYNANGSVDTTFNAITASPTFTANGAAVVLDPLAHVFDAELAAQGHYAGASLRLQRSGAPDPHDAFVATGLLGPLTEGAQLSYSGVGLGLVQSNSGGVLTLAFDSNASQVRVDGVLQAIGYAHPGGASTTAVELDWQFSDGNETDAQGSGGALTSVGKTLVSLDAINDAPVNTVPGPQQVEKDGTIEITGVSVSDPDSATLQVTLRAGDGRVSLAGTAGLSFVSGDGTADPSMTFTGTIGALNAALAKLEYAAGRGFGNGDTITITTTDLGAGAPMSDSDSIIVTRAKLRGHDKHDHGDRGDEAAGSRNDPIDMIQRPEVLALNEVVRPASAPVLALDEIARRGPFEAAGDRIDDPTTAALSPHLPHSSAFAVAAWEYERAPAMTDFQLIAV